MLAHLIRDLNDDLRKSPFDAELESFVSSVRDLIVPIFEAVEKFGLKTRNLRKFQKGVEQFYDRKIAGTTYHSDRMITFQKRFSKYKVKLFVFLDRDGVPWNNNMAERAIRQAVAKRMRIALQSMRWAASSQRPDRHLSGQDPAPDTACINKQRAIRVDAARQALHRLGALLHAHRLIDQVIGVLPFIHECREPARAWTACRWRSSPAVVLAAPPRTLPPACGTSC